METLVKFLPDLIGTSVMQLAKLPIAFLNLIPTPIKEIVSARIDADGSSRGIAIREFHTKYQGSRKLHLGSLIVAWQRGVLVRVQIGHDGKFKWGIYSEDYKDLVSKWTY